MFNFCDRYIVLEYQIIFYIYTIYIIYSTSIEHRPKRMYTRNGYHSRSLTRARLSLDSPACLGLSRDIMDVNGRSLITLVVTAWTTRTSS